ncbi:MAG: zinc ribbon domain-containing protein [Lachnospiraceae bacterium]|nr:zinc ribbon domain-containing protein [Lachnospiraceae bacterium]
MRSRNVQEEDVFEAEYRELKAKRSRAIVKLGNIIYEENKDKDMSGTAYADCYKDIFEAEKDMIMLEKRRLASKGFRKCEKCGAELAIDSVFCNKCGTRQGELETEVVMASHKCPKCGAKLEDGDVFCTACGYKL